MSGDWDLPTIQGYENQLLVYFSQAAGIDVSDATVAFNINGDRVKIDFTATGTQEEMQTITSGSFAQSMRDVMRTGNTDMYNYFYVDSTSSGT